MSVYIGYSESTVAHIIIRYSHHGWFFINDVHPLVRPLVRPSCSPLVHPLQRWYVHPLQRWFITSGTPERFQINVSYIRNVQIQASVAPFIAATGASWPEKFGGNIKIV